jgi:hypothetical protein
LEVRRPEGQEARRPGGQEARRPRTSPRVDHLKGASLKNAQSLFSNIRLGWKGQTLKIITKTRTLQKKKVL